MDEDPIEQAAKLPHQKDVNIRALVPLALTRLSKDACMSVSFLGSGTFNHTYRVNFADGSAIAASVSSNLSSDYTPDGKLSEICTMAFVRDSGHYQGIPVPQILAYDLTYDNPLKAPYVFMEVVEGVVLTNLEDQLPLKDDQMKVVRAVADIHAELLKPVPFTQIGGLQLGAGPGEFSVGPMYSRGNTLIGGPYNSLVEFWRSRLDAEVLEALREWCRIEEDKIPYADGVTPQTFGEILQLLAGLIPRFAPPPNYSHYCLIHDDIALRNFVFDPNDLTRIVGVLDWGGSYIGPVLLSARFLHDLHTENMDPAPRGPGEYWSRIPYDWTSLGDTSKWPVVFSRGSEFDLVPRGAMMVARFYLRKHYAACVAGKGGLQLATLFDDASMYLRLHDIIRHGHHAWFRHERWIRETYWRLRLLGPGKESCVIRGPQAYTSDGQRVALDLTLDGELQYGRLDGEEDERHVSTE